MHTERLEEAHEDENQPSEQSSSCPSVTTLAEDPAVIVLSVKRKHKLGLHAHHQMSPSCHQTQQCVI
jgi:hypothetical protein